MARPRRGEQPALTSEQIKNCAREQMRTSGTAGVSLRGIARQLGVTAPAIYNYFSRLDDLITALIIDGFTDLAVAMETARNQVPGETNGRKVLAMALAYRAWAVAHPIDFQLIYGNPIPGYTAPSEVTSPLAFRPFLGLFELFEQALHSGELVIPPEYQSTAAEIRAHLEFWKEHMGVTLPDAAICLLMSGWARIHGMVLLELFHHSRPVIGDPAVFYQQEMEAYLGYLGMQV